MKLLVHLFKITTKVLSTRYPYSRLRLWMDYLKVFFHSVSHHKVKSRRSAGQAWMTERFLGYEIRFFAYAQLLHMIEEIFIYQIYKTALTNPSPLILDCGSNIGLSILYFSKIYPSAHVVGFEADPQVFEILQANLQSNGLKNVVVHNVALTNNIGVANLYQKNSEPGSLSASVFQSQDTTPSEVSSTRLSTYVTHPIDLVKVDVEGAEGEILDDLIRAEALQKINQLIIEFHPRVVDPRVDYYLSKLETHGFTREHVALPLVGDTVITFQMNSKIATR